MHDLEAIAAVQQVVCECVGEESPELQKRIRQRFMQNRELISAQLLGL
ncbi:MAG: hypothetical protein ACYC0H_17750 [Solirubrobacteraceae bacterium]